MRKISICLLAAFIGLSITGCGGDKNVGRVQGTVTLDNQPLPNAKVIFEPENGRPSGATTDEKGQYQLKYTSDNNGALIGTHRVTISTRSSGNPDEGIEPTPELVPAKYNSQSELVKEVTKGKNIIDFNLTSEGKISNPDENGE